MNTVNGKVAPYPDMSTGTTSVRAPSMLAREPTLPRVLWDAWKAYSHRASGYQANLLLSGVYFLVVGPIALVARLAGTKLLDLDPRPRSSYWIERKPAENTLGAMERQF
jgi:hypothetical protein